MYTDFSWSSKYASRSWNQYWLPIILLFFLLEDKDPRKPPSALLNKNLPEFVMVNLFNENKILTNVDFNDKQIIINFFSSWCAPCKVELPLLLKLKNNYPKLIIIGVDHKDIKLDAIKFLEDNGNPYHYVGIDKDGKIGLEFGVFGLPETFITNNKGKIIFKHLGLLTEKVLKNEIYDLLQ